MAKRPTMRQRARQAAHTQKMAGNAAASRARGVAAAAEGRHLIASRSILSVVLTLAKEAYVLEPDGVHGPQHWLRVLRNGRELARFTPDADLAIVEHFALLHDCKREDDEADPYHGERAAHYISTIANQIALSEAQIAVLMEACAGHEHGETSDDPTIGCCWDADRLELSRLHRRPIPELMSTSAAMIDQLRAGAWTRGTRLAEESL